MSDTNGINVNDKIKIRNMASACINASNLELYKDIVAVLKTIPEGEQFICYIDMLIKEQKNIIRHNY